MKWFQYGQSMRLCEQLPWGFDFPLKQQSRISAFQRQTPSLLLLLLLLPLCLSDVTEVDFIHVHKGSPTLESPGRLLPLVWAMVTTTDKGQSPMVMSNWVCSHYWPSELWSTDGELASPNKLHSNLKEAQLCLQVLLCDSTPSACVGPYITPSCATVV